MSKHEPVTRLTHFSIMPLSKHHIDIQSQPASFDVAALGADIKREVSDIDFALLMGSAKEGVVAPHSDLDLALFLRVAPSQALYEAVGRVVASHVGPDVRADIGILNQADPVYRYEALKGTLLFYRDEERWLNFYSVTCRLYEHQIADYKRQWRYRLERGSLCS
ncbi:MAG: nucleotidyltransferase domain-containing protein [bacterium]|nr:nucleotidyltransferase domain-containing protein [bacterium]